MSVTHDHEAAAIVWEFLESQRGEDADLPSGRERKPTPIVARTLAEQEPPEPVSDSVQDSDAPVHSTRAPKPTSIVAKGVSFLGRLIFIVVGLASLLLTLLTLVDVFLLPTVGGFIAVMIFGSLGAWCFVKAKYDPAFAIPILVLAAAVVSFGYLLVDGNRSEPETARPPVADSSPHPSDRPIGKLLASKTANEDSPIGKINATKPAAPAEATPAAAEAPATVIHATDNAQGKHAELPFATGAAVVEAPPALECDPTIPYVFNYPGANQELRLTRCSLASSGARVFRDVPEELSRFLIKLVQRRLADLGFNVGKPDGISGKKTINGIRRFQASQKLTIDGRITFLLLDRLQRPQ